MIITTTKILFFFILISVLYVGDSLGNDKEKNCLDCHPKYYKKLKGKIEHKPFKDKKCLECHETHGFTNEIKLKSIRQEVCIKCHDLLKDIEKERKIYESSETREEITSNLVYWSKSLKWKWKKFIIVEGF